MDGLDINTPEEVEIDYKNKSKNNQERSSVATSNQSSMKEQVTDSVRKFIKEQATKESGTLTKFDYSNKKLYDLEFINELQIDL